jgi:hypothetical protein
MGLVNIMGMGDRRDWTYISHRDLEEIVGSVSFFIQGGSKGTCANDENNETTASKVTAEGIDQKCLATTGFYESLCNKESFL